MKQIIHLCSYYNGSSLYSNLVKAIACIGIKQHVFVPLRRRDLKRRHQVVDCLIRYSWLNIIEPWHRVLFHQKVRNCFREFCKKQIFEDHNDVVHAHSLFSDGAVALKIKENFGLPYVVTIRNTDINYFYKYAFYLRKHGHKILEKAGAIIFLGPIVADDFLLKLPPQLSEKLSNSVHIIPNGISDYWFRHTPVNADCLKINNTILFVGDINANKNIEGLIQACALLRMSGTNVLLDVVGSASGKRSSKLLDQMASREFVRYHGTIDTKKQLCNMYRRASVVAVPSHRESFGLIYAEALSQGVPILCSKKQGFDGWFDNGCVGESVDSYNPENIANALQRCLTYKQKSFHQCIKQAKKFDWNDISRNLVNIYKSLK